MKKAIARIFGVVLTTASVSLSAGGAGQNQLQAFTPNARTPLITQYVDESKRVTLTGNTHPAANAANDRGLVPDQMMMSHLFVQLKRSTEQQNAADAFVTSQHDPSSPNYHHWIMPNEFGQRFGLAQSDIDAVANWLRNQGFQVHQVSPNMVIDFSGTAGQVRSAFGTEIHYLDVNGERRYANMSDPKIPAALAPAVAGVVRLNDFKLKAMNVLKQLGKPVPGDTAGTNYLVAPYDLYKIYNFPPYSNTTFPAGFMTGKGVTIDILSQSDVYSGTVDWQNFRNMLGIPTSIYKDASLTTLHPGPGSGGTCTAAGVTGDAGEAAIDVEWSAAAAPDAKIVLVSCSQGIFVALDNLLTNGAALPNIISISYGQSEQLLGASTNNFINSAYQTAAAAGVSIFVSTGDSGADAQDQNHCTTTTCDQNGINVNGLASTPYDVAVGGTDFQDLLLNQIPTYWNTANSTSPLYASAKSYIPELPWNDSCASTVLAQYRSGSSITYGSSGYCNTADGLQFLNNVGGGGGKSHCATGGGATCAGYAKPFFQQMLGNPGDKVRDIPDVALFASSGFMSHAYVVCWSANASCAGAPSTWSLFGGTSVAAPIWAGIQALVVQKTAENWGNPDANYYALARSEYGAAGTTTCKSDLGNGVASTCTFYDITTGDMDMPCTGTKNCYKPSGTYGVLSSAASSYLPTYAAGKGWDFATGIGTPNVRNLLAQMAGGAEATFIQPTDGSTVTPTYTFKWTAGRNVAYYQLVIGSTPGGHDIYNGAVTTLHSVTVKTLPTSGQLSYVTLYSMVGTTLQSQAITIFSCPLNAC